jgi:hypothetical protein
MTAHGLIGVPEFEQAYGMVTPDGMAAENRKGLQERHNLIFVASQSVICITPDAQSERRHPNITNLVAQIPLTQH